MKFKVGQRWKMRCGEIAVITRINPDRDKYHIKGDLADIPLVWTKCGKIGQIDTLTTI